MKKILTLAVISLFLISSLSACKPAGSDSSTTSSAVSQAANTYELALITDIGTIDDKSFNQGAWEGLEKYAKEKSITYKYYQPAEKTTDAYVAAITLAVNGGAKLVVTPGYLFEPAIFKAQDMYPNVKFILLDGQPQDGTYTTFRIEANVLSIFYAEEQAGFLAGYAAVRDGMKKLGFMGGIAVPAVIRFGYGFVQGAEYAAKEMNLAKDSVEVKYNYLGGFGPDPTYQTKAASWYNQGTEVIFAAAGGAGNSVMAAAEAANKKVIGVDGDQSGESPTVITSAMKTLGTSVYNAIKEYYAGTFQGGKIIRLDAKDDGIGLVPKDSFTKFTTFNKAQYDAIYAKLVNNTDKIVDGIRKDMDGTATVKLADLITPLVNVIEIK
ncbi:MAG: BMP family lipoprotein [Saccharofermentanales bacterium]